MSGAWEKSPTPPPASAFDLLRWKRRDYAESAAREQQQAYQPYRQGERVDPQPGSGIETFSYSLDGGEWTAYVAPIAVSDGLHTVTFRAQDLAGHVSEISQSVQVDTIAPQVNTSLAGEQANGWYLFRVTFTASASDSGSGVARIEYALDGSSWQSYNAM